MRSHTRTLTLLGAAAMILATTAGAENIFNGKNLDGWSTKPHSKNKSHWTVGTAALSESDPRELSVKSAGSELINAHAHGLDAFTDKQYGDVSVELEVMVPRGSNSGIYLMGEYEIQVLDSSGKAKPGVGDMGAVYGVHAPKNPKYHQPGQWNRYRIDFRAPRFDASGKKVENAKFVRVELNGQIIHENVEVPKPTRSCLTGNEKPTGPLMLQGDHGPVAYRNIRVTELD